MFDMQKIGANIASLRKRSGMSQQALADAMGISPQAVSNWERGQSMPDIAKLGELSELFGVSIDYILVNRVRTQEEPSQERTEKKPVRNMDDDDDDDDEDDDEDEAKEEDDANLFRPGMFGGSRHRHRHIHVVSQGNLSGLAAVAPFLSSDVVGEIALDKWNETHELGEIAELLPFLSNRVLAEIASEALEHGGSVTELLPFLPDDVVVSAAEKAYREGGMSALAEYAPFLPNGYLDRLVREQMKKSDTNQ